MLAVSALSDYVYCPRKLYLQYVLKIAPPPKDIIVKGSIKHKVFEAINNAEEMLISSITERTDINLLYERVYYDLLKDVISKNINKLKEVGLDSIDFFRESWPMFLREANTRVKNIKNFIEKYHIYEKSYGKN